MIPGQGAVFVGVKVGVPFYSCSYSGQSIAWPLALLFHLFCVVYVFFFNYYFLVLPRLVNLICWITGLPFLYFKWQHWAALRPLLPMIGNYLTSLER